MDNQGTAVPDLKSQQPSTSGENTSIMLSLKRFGEIIGIGSAIMLTLSVVYDYLFLCKMRLGFSVIPTSISDHMRTTLIWAVPVTIICTGLAGYIDIIISGLGEVVKSEGKITKFIVKWWFSVPLLLLAFSCLMNYIHPESSFWLCFSAVLLIYLCLARKDMENKSAYFIKWGSFVIVTIFLVGYLGYSRGEAMLNQNSIAWECDLQRNGKIATKQLCAIRRFCNIAIMVDSDKQIIVVPDSQIVEMRRLQKEIPTQRSQEGLWECNINHDGLISIKQLREIAGTGDVAVLIDENGHAIVTIPKTIIALHKLPNINMDSIKDGKSTIGAP